MLKPANTPAASAVNPDRAVPDAPIPASVMVTDTTGSDGGEDVDASMAAQRLAAYHAVHSWRDRPLYPFSFQREALFRVIRKVLPFGGSLLPEEYDDDYASEAALLLFLCATPAAREKEQLGLENIRHSADLVVNCAYEWADKNVPRAERQAAGHLAFKILREAEINIAVPQPTGRGQKEGN